jgi:hypothetical protein
MSRNSRVNLAVCWISLSLILRVFNALGAPGMFGVGGGASMGLGSGESDDGGGGSLGISAGTGTGGGGGLGRVSGRR